MSTEDQSWKEDMARPLGSLAAAHLARFLKENPGVELYVDPIRNHTGISAKKLLALGLNDTVQVVSGNCRSIMRFDEYRLTPESLAVYIQREETRLQALAAAKPAHATNTAAQRPAVEKSLYRGRR